MKLQVLIITLFFAVLCNAQDDFDNEHPCNSAVRCAYNFDIVWATDGTSCYVYRNPCLLANVNCERQLRQDEALQVISKRRCQSLCHHKCPKTRKPVCGFYNSEYRQFSSECAMEYYMCKTGKTYVYFYEGPCVDPLSLAN